MTRRILFQVHWLLGITVGLVLALMGLTGATMSFEDEITGLLNSRTISTASVGKGAERMTPDALLASIQAQFPGEDIRPLVLSADPLRAAQFRVRQPSGAATFYADPYSGHVLGKAAGSDFFSFIEDLHRFLALPLTEGRRDSEIGKQITGVAAFSLIFFALSGLYLRWPRKPLDWRSWFVLDLKRTGRNLYRSLHAVIGAWMVLSYLLSALTGLWWSYGWYHDLVSKTLGIEEMRRAPAADRMPKGSLAIARGNAPRAAGPRKKRGAGAAAEPGRAISFDAAWNTFVQRVGPDFGRASLTVSRDGKSVSIERFNGPLRGGLMDRYTFDAATGSLKVTDLYADRPISKVVGTSMLSVHSGSVFGIAGRVAVMLCSLTMPLFAITGWLLYLGRRRKRREAGAIAIAIPSLPPVATHDVDSDVLIVHASQTGTAERIASMSAAAFASAGRAARLLPISALDSVSLAAARCVLFVVSTYGDGQAPDRARSFVRQMMARPAPSGGFSYAVLALGDREYPDFCHFGRQVDEWLTRAGARKLFERIEMNGRDDEGEQRWRQQLSKLGAAATSAWEEAPVQAWTLAARQLLNPGSQGGGVHVVRLKAGAAAPQWTAGDVVEIYPRNDPAAVTRFLSAAGLAADTRVHGQRLDAHLSGAVLPLPDAVGTMSAAELVDTLKPLPHRDYSIASVPADGCVDLVVRQLVKSSGELGVGSGWLTAHAGEGDAVQARIRTNVGFHRPEGERALILIGNGTGFAGLRAHLRERSLAGSKGHWLLFGERNARYDAFFKHELDAWRADGTLLRIDLAYSRDDDCGRYVQDLIRQSAGEIFTWVAGGAAIMVCGSLAGMAPAVDKELRAAIGDERVSMMVANGLYRRDVY